MAPRAPAVRLIAVPTAVARHAGNRPRSRPAATETTQPEEQHRTVDRDLVEPRQVPGGGKYERPHRQPGERERRRAAGQAEQQALEEDRARESPPAGAQGEADRELAGARLRAHEEQVGDVHAGDQQQDPDRAQQEPQRRPDVAHDGLEERDDQGPEAALGEIGRGVLVRKDVEQIRHQRLQLGLPLCRRDAVRKARHAPIEEVAQLRGLPVDA